MEKQENPKDIEYLIKNIFGGNDKVYSGKSENIKLKLKKNQNTEIESIAQDIIGRIREDETLRFRDFAIYTNNFDEYEFCIKRIFNEYEIPFSFDDTSELKFSNLVIYILTLLKIAEDGLDINKLFLLLKTNLFDILNEDLNYLENYILEFGIKGFNLNKEFKKNNKEDAIGCIVYDLEKLNSIRKRVVNSINNFTNQIMQKTDAKGKIEVIYNHIIEN